MGEKIRRSKAGSGITMRELDLSVEMRRRYAEAANAQTDAAQAAGIASDAWLREQFTHDLVFGVWQDAAAPGSIAVALLRGHGRLLLVSQGTNPKQATQSVIRCGSAEEAEAMCRVFGDGRAKIA